MRNDNVKVALTISRRLRDEFKQRADKQGISINKHLCIRLQEQVLGQAKKDNDTSMLKAVLGL